MSNENDLSRRCQSESWNPTLSVIVAEAMPEFETDADAEVEADAESDAEVQLFCMILRSRRFFSDQFGLQRDSTQVERLTTDDDDDDDDDDASGKKKNQQK